MTKHLRFVSDWRSFTLQQTVMLVTAFLVIAPLIPLFYQAFLNAPIYDASAIFTLGNFTRLFEDPTFIQAVQNTAYFAIITTIVAQVIAVVAVVLMTRTDMPGRKVFGALILAPVFVSHLVLAIGYYTLYGPTGYITIWATQLFGAVPWNLYSLTGMAVVAGASQAPIAYLFCAATTKATDPTLESAALIAGARPIRVLVNVTLPLLRPAIIYGLSINFVMAIEMLSIPLIFGQSSGIDVFSSYIYKNIIRTSVPDHGIVGVAAMLLLLVVLALLWLQGFLNRNSQRFVTVGGKAIRPQRFPLGGLKWPAFALMAFYLLASIVLPLGGLVVRSFAEIFTPLLPLVEVLTFHNYIEAFSSPIITRSLINTIVVASVTALICTFLVFAICLVAYRSDFWGARITAVIVQIPRAVPGVFAGVALLYLVLALPVLGWFRNTVAILIFAYLTRFIPIGIGAVQPALQQISSDLDKSARVTGATWWGASLTVLLPLLKPALFACFVLVFIHALKDYVTAIFLVAPGSEVIGSTLLVFWEDGQLGAVSALSTILIIITAILVALARKIFGVKLYD